MGTLYLKNSQDFSVLLEELIQLLFDILSHSGVSALYLQYYGHLNVKKGGFNPPVHLVFHFFQPNLACILRFTKGISGLYGDLKL